MFGIFESSFSGWPLTGNEGMESYMIMMGIHSLIPHGGPASFSNDIVFCCRAEIISPRPEPPTQLARRRARARMAKASIIRGRLIRPWLVSTLVVGFILLMEKSCTN